MKKLIFGALVAAVAVGANAASMDWKVSVDTADKQKQFMFFNADDRTAVMALLDAGGANIYDAVAAYAYVDGDSNAQFATPSKTASKSGRLANIDKGDSFFMILFDTTTAGSINNGLAYKTTGDVATTGYVYDGAADPPEPSPGNYEITPNFTGSGTVGPAEPVPEPTSGLLLLLGVAGMALRRRRA